MGWWLTHSSLPSRRGRRQACSGLVLVAGVRCEQRGVSALWASARSANRMGEVAPSRGAAAVLALRASMVGLQQDEVEPQPAPPVYHGGCLLGKITAVQCGDGRSAIGHPYMGVDGQMANTANDRLDNGKRGSRTGPLLVGW